MLISCLNSSPLAAFTSSVVGMYTPMLGAMLIRWAARGLHPGGHEHAAYGHEASDPRLATH